MNCHYCGTALRDNEIFCRHCGTRRQEEPAPAVAVCGEIAAAPVAEEAPAARPTTVYQEKTFDWQPYGAPAKEEPLVDFRQQTPKLQLPVKRGLGKMILLGIVTLGIYPMVIWSRLVGEVNMVASRYDGERSMSYFGMMMLAPMTLGIHSLVWMNKLCRRIGNELNRRSVPYLFGSKDFWLWAFSLGLLNSICTGVCSALLAIGSELYVVIWILLAVSLLTLAGPLVFTAKLMKAMNHLNEDFNING